MNDFKHNGHRPRTEESYETDMAGAIDRPEERLAEQFNISVFAARMVHTHILEQIRSGINESVPAEVRRVVAWLLRPCRNHKAKTYGLAFSFELIDSGENMSQVASRLGLHRADLSHWKRDADRKLHSTNTTYGKSPEACEKYRVGRLRVLDREKSTTNG